MSRPEIPDTSILIARARDRHVWPAFHSTIAAGRLWLSSVAIAEFYAGTRSRDDALILDRIVAAAQRIDRIVTPTVEEWAVTGRLIARYIRHHGPLRPRDHLADVLILVSAARLRGAVVTLNIRHFNMWASVATASGLDVTVIPVPQP